jgi:hypothetical protein
VKRTAQKIEESKEAQKRLSVTIPEESRKWTGRGSHPNSRRNLIAPWPKGVSGNPGGRPKDTSANLARNVFEGNEEVIYKAMVKALLKGNAYVFQVLAERAYGKLKESHTVDLTVQAGVLERLEAGRRRISAA